MRGKDSVGNEKEVVHLSESDISKFAGQLPRKGGTSLWQNMIYVLDFFRYLFLSFSNSLH